MKLIDNWWRTLTHGYATWCIYVSIVVQFAFENLPTFSEVVPGWASMLILAAALALRVLKQDSISAGDDGVAREQA